MPYVVASDIQGKTVYLNNDGEFDELVENAARFQSEEGALDFISVVVPPNAISQYYSLKVAD